MARSPAPITNAPGKQEVCTPREFLDACEAKFGRIIHDLAADPTHRVCDSYFTANRALDWDDTSTPLWIDGLDRNAPWPATHGHERLWCNPPFSSIPPFLEEIERRQSCRCGQSHNTLVLVPASTDTAWFADYVQGRASIYWVRPRIKFVGHASSFPKALMLLDYNDEPVFTEVRQWEWNAPHTPGPIVVYPGAKVYTPGPKFAQISRGATHLAL